MEINLNKNLIDLEGKAIENSNIGKIVANALASHTGGDALKFWDWAKKLYSGKKLDLDPSDLGTLKDFIANHSNFPNLTKAQILEILK